MRWFLSLAMVLMCAFACYAQDLELATAKAKAALALAKFQRDPLPASDAKAKATAGFKTCQENRDLGCLTDLSEGIKRADAEKKPLFILVGMACNYAPEIRNSFPNAVWVHVGDSFNGNRAPRLLVRPIGASTGIPFLRKDLGPGATEEIRGVLRQVPGQISSENDPQVWPTIPRRGRSPVADC